MNAACDYGLFYAAYDGKRTVLRQQLPKPTAYCLGAVILPFSFCRVDWMGSPVSSTTLAKRLRVMSYCFRLVKNTFARQATQSKQGVQTCAANSLFPRPHGSGDNSIVRTSLFVARNEKRHSGWVHVTQCDSPQQRTCLHANLHVLLEGVGSESTVAIRALNQVAKLNWSQHTFCREATTASC